MLSQSVATVLDLEHEPKQLEASPPQQSGLQLESASLNQ